MIETGIVTVGGVKYATGLYWQPTASKSIAKAARDAAKQPGQPVEFYAARDGVKGIRIGQFGLGTTEMGHKINMPSIAASLANQQPGSWVGAFQVEQGFLVITVRDDLIDPEGDELFDDEAEAMSRLDEEITRGGLQKIYAPDSWAVPGADDAHISVLLSGRKDCRLKYIKPPVGIILGVLAAVVIGGTVYSSYGLYQQHLEQKAYYASSVRQAANELEQKKRKMSEDNAKVILQFSEQLEPTIKVDKPKSILTLSQSKWLDYIPVWRKQPTPKDWLDACREPLQDIPGTVLGWRMTGFQCAKGQVTIDYSRDNKALATYPENGIVDPSGNRLRVAYNMSSYINRAYTGPDSEPEKDLSDIRFVTETLLSRGRSELSYGREELEKPPYDGVSEPDTPPPAAKWQKRGFMYKVSYSPWNLDKIFNGIPGVVFSKLTYSGGHWELEGEIYEVR